MKITTREQAVELLGTLGANLWDKSEQDSDSHFDICGEVYAISKRPPKLGSLTDEELAFEYSYLDDHREGLRAAVTADREREWEILAQATEEELMIQVREAIGFVDKPALNEYLRDAIATVRAHDRAKGEQYPEPRPVSEWTEEMGRALCWHRAERDWFVDCPPNCERYTHFIPVPKEPK